MFTDPESADYTLMEGSPCIDGIVIENIEYCGESSDMGSYKYITEDCYEEVTYGCMDMSACNYDAGSTENDNTCTYTGKNYDCEGNCTVEVDECGVCGDDGLTCFLACDVNFDGVLDILDVVSLVAYILGSVEYNAEQAAAAYLTQDGIINVQDIVALVSNIIGGQLSRGESTAGLTLYYGNGTVSYKADGDIAGIQLRVSGDYNITNNYLPEGWEIANSDNTILLYSLDGSSLDHKALFDYTGDFWIESTIVADWYESSVITLSILIPREFDLSPAYPNPFNPVTILSFELPEKVEVSIVIYNLQGRQIAALTDSYMDAGYHSIIWDANSYASGVYFVKMVVGEFVSTQKLMLVK